MDKELTQKDRDSALFVNLVMMLATSTMQQLGAMPNPVTNKTEVNLDGAQMTIDMLTMLRDRTKGNLSKDEEKLLNELLSSLQMNFVAASQSAPAQKEKADSPQEEKREESGKDDKPPQGGDTGDARYHKSYG